jgi:diguanylate cyclase (GGDEF)-like protein
MSRGLSALRTGLGREQSILVSLVLAYLVSGKLGLMLGFGHPAVTLVWPPAGLALGALLVLGNRAWPAILLAAVLLYAAVLGPHPAVLLLAAGNTGEGLLAAYLINRFAGGRHALQNPRNTFRFAGIVALTSITVSATIGVLTLTLFGLAPWTDYGAIWLSWTVGNFASSMLVAPLVLLFIQGSKGRWRTRQWLEAIAAFLAVVLIGLVVFCGFLPELGAYSPELLCVPVLLWPAFRLGRRAAAVALITLAALAITGTLNGFGPLLRMTPTASLTMVLSFMSLTAVMTLGLAALAAEYGDQEAQLLELVVTDPLTGLPNYRRLVDVLGTQIGRSSRHDKSFAVVFFDMDGLKRINDELGHLIGSRAVCRFAETLKSACRETDTAARYGGDEFVAVLADTDEEGARLVIRRVAERLAEDRDKPELSVSAGVAIYPRDGGTPTTLLSAADRALYAVKAEKANARRRGVVPFREWTSVG